MTGARLWEGLADHSTPLSSPLWVRDGRIVALGEAAGRAPSELPRIELAGRHLVPGLIDAHVHLALDPLLRTPAEQLAVPPDERERAMRQRARSMLDAGITTARDCGGGDHAEHRLRREIDSGALLGPRLLCCGQPLTIPDGHCAFWGGAVRDQAEIDAMVERQVEAGSDWIKVMVTGGLFTPGSRAGERQFDRARLDAMVQAAARHGRFVAGHCHATAGIADALAVGLRTIEHASFAGPEGFGTGISEALLRRLGESEVWISPTVNAGWRRRIEDRTGEPTDFFRRMSRCLRLQKEHGARLIASTDAGIPGVHHADLLDGLLALARFAALRPVDVMRAATSEAARVLGLEGETGRLEAGLSADFLVLEQDPLRDLEALRDPEVVVLRGRWLDRARRRGG